MYAFLTAYAFANVNFQDISKIPLQNGCQFPSAASPVTMATVISATTMTTKESVKKAMVVQLDISVSSSFCSAK